MKIVLPDKSLLTKTGEVDYFDWNYKFPIKYIQLYRFKTIIKMLGRRRFTNLLEAGTGSGVFLPELSRHCINIFACDIHNHFDVIEKLLLHYKIMNYNLKTQSIETTDYADESFDAVVAVSLLEFVKNKVEAINEIKRILKDGGSFFTICPMSNRFLDAILSLYTTKKPEEEFGDSRNYVSKILEENFTVVSKGYMLPLIGRFFPVYTHYELRK